MVGGGASVMLWISILLILQTITSSPHLNVVYVIDSYSFQYFILSIASITQQHSVNQPSLQIPTPPLHIHVIIATSTHLEYSDLKYNVSKYFSCYPFLTWTSYEYLHLQHYTNLMKRLEAQATAGAGGRGGGSTPAHWLSMTEKLRNYIPEIIPSLKRYIYLDNDVVMTKRDILYHLWHHDLQNSPVGVVGNQLHSVEFDLVAKIYDLSHPFIQQSFNLIPNSTHPILDSNDLKRIIPYYPNNGVMLVNASRWNELKICSKARYGLID
jgi:lipopolysaccharide biosynthesis glycosyltransferase